MGSQNNTRSSLFLIELIIAILFFSLGAAVCVQAFVKAHTLTGQAQDLSFASSAVSSAASAVKYTDGSLEGIQAYFPQAFADGDEVAVDYDSDFAPCSDGADAAYTLRIRTGNEDDVRSASIRMDGLDGQTIYALDLRWPVQEADHG